MLYPRVLILRTAGTNCDYETKYAFEKAGAKVDVVHINLLLSNKAMLKEYQILTLPGGFTYGDDISAGKILANQIKFHLEEEIDTFIQEKKLILGICNGFQALTKAGLLPSINRYQQEATLTFNDSNMFEDRWLSLKVCSNKSVFIKKEDIPSMYLPIAHKEGKFITKDKDTLDKIINNQQIVFIYENKNSAQQQHTNNSFQNTIAGICDPTGLILGIMPHPERYVEPTQHPHWTRSKLKEIGEGFIIFKNAVDYVKSHF